MGASESVILNTEDVKTKLDAGNNEIENKCGQVKCAPEKFENNKHEYHNNNQILLLIFIIILFISLFFIKK